MDERKDGRLHVTRMCKIGNKKKADKENSPMHTNGGRKMEKEENNTAARKCSECSRSALDKVPLKRSNPFVRNGNTGQRLERK